jgi:hypothetical protein
MERPLDFFIVGAQKAGTTALFSFLGDHTEIFLPSVKETHFFVREEFFRLGTRYLSPLYQSLRGEALVGGADVEAMYFPDSAARMYAYAPSMRLIAVLRNPVDRAYSAYWFARRLGFEDAPTFEEGLAQEAARVGGGYSERSKLTYLGHGYYAEQLDRYLERFPRERLHVVLHEDLSRHPQETLATVIGWLGLRYEHGSIDTTRRVNVAGFPRSMLLQRLVRSDDSAPKQILRRVVPTGLRYVINRYLRQPLLKRNIRPEVYPPMLEETRVRLREHFSPHNARLADLIGRDLSGWG